MLNKTKNTSFLNHTIISKQTLCLMEKYHKIIKKYHKLIKIFQKNYLLQKRI